MKTHPFKKRVGLLFEILIHVQFERSLMVYIFREFSLYVWPLDILFNVRFTVGSGEKDLLTYGAEEGA